MSKSQPLPPDVQQALQNGQMVEAFRRLRQHQSRLATGGARASAPSTRSSRSARSAKGTRLPGRPKPPAALTGHVEGLPRRRPGLAPGEVPPSRDGLVLWLVALALLAWLLLRWLTGTL